MIKVNLLELSHLPIFEQLQIEEALMRVDNENWCILNRGTPDSIVMGISGKIEKLIHAQHLKNNPIPVIRRFSGGGTVVVDSNTCFATFIFNQSTLDISPFPQHIMRWTEEFYRPLFDNSDFALRENDYVFGEKKFGGNAQYIQKNRWLHHTSFLWDYSPQKMDYLLLPEKRPAYREDRPHTDFLCPLKSRFPSIDAFLSKIKEELARQFLLTAPPREIHAYLEQPHRRSTQIVL